jgi:hypothetical protein
MVGKGRGELKRRHEVRFQEELRRAAGSGGMQASKLDHMAPSKTRLRFHALRDGARVCRYHHLISGSPALPIQSKPLGAQGSTLCCVDVGSSRARKQKQIALAFQIKTSINKMFDSRLRSRAEQRRFAYIWRLAPAAEGAARPLSSQGCCRLPADC